MLSANDIRQQFIDFFVHKHGHTFVPSSPVVPVGDDTLLFANAGMNQFKDVFLGTGTRPYQRAVNTQKCIRAGGKHNDLDDVGKDTYHHTFFEMLGNWSFGDYFKKEAIGWAWELLTEVWGLDKTRLHATVFEGSPEEGVPRDDEAFEFWKTMTDIDHAHIHLGNKKDNFWEMGETGPCGPCTEIHYDKTPDRSGGGLVNKGTPDVIEIWNLVFIQFNRNPDRSLTPLPAKHVDTGMGFERVTAVIQGKDSNYDTDVFTPIMNEIATLTNRKYGKGVHERVNIAFRAIADHARMATFAIADGAQPGNKKRDAVLRSVIRRAVRFGYQFFYLRSPFLFSLVPVIVEQMGNAFPELRANPSRIQEVIRKEEQEFLDTIESAFDEFQLALLHAVAHEIGKKQSKRITNEIPSKSRVGGPRPETGRSLMVRFEDAAGNVSRQSLQTLLPNDPTHFKNVIHDLSLPSPVISGEKAFQLHDTYGLYIDITEQMALEAGLGVDRERFEALMTKAKGKNRQARKTNDISAISGELPTTDDSRKYKGPSSKAEIVGWVKENLVGNSGQFNCGDQLALLLNKTNFYAEQGGQVGDKGTIKTPTGTFEVEDTQRLGEAVLHVGRVSEGAVKVGQAATLEVGGERQHTMRNHTATHLLNWALRKVLGEHVEQKGSLVDPLKTRFDFTHNEPLNASQIGEVERLVNEQIYADLPVTAVIESLAEAKTISGVRAVFGEKYPDPVRVLIIGAKKPADATVENSVEFCGGTHLEHTGQAGFFKIVAQELVAKGVRRLTAVTGREAVVAVQKLAGVVDDLTTRFRCKPEELALRVEAMQEEIKKLQQQIKKAATGDLTGAADKLFDAGESVNGARLIVGQMPAGPDEQMRTQVDRLKQKAGSGVIVLGWATQDEGGGKVGLLAAITDDLVKKGLNAGKLIAQIAPVVGGKGGGRPNMAQAGGKETAKLGEALDLAKKLAAEQLQS